jgi:hypothetical protein
MPYFDYALVHGDSGDITTERDQESADLTAAVIAAVEWGKEIRRLSGEKSDTSFWPLNIVPSVQDGGTATTPALYGAEDVRPDEWAEETDTPAALI